MKNNYESFNNKYKPISNRDGAILLEPYGDDSNIVETYPASRVWSLIEENGKRVLLAGKHMDKALFFIICSNGHDLNNEKYLYE